MEGESRKNTSRKNTSRKNTRDENIELIFRDRKKKLVAREGERKGHTEIQTMEEKEKEEERKEVITGVKRVDKNKGHR